MPIEYQREHEEAKRKMFKLDKRTYTNATWDKVVPETSPEAAFLVGGEGAEIDEAVAAKLGLTTKDASADTEDKALSGPLPDDFPGRSALADAGINTYAQLRKVDDVTDLPGVGPATAAKIAEALG